jgi:hypothetical protein
MQYTDDATEQDMLDAFVSAEGGLSGRGYPDQMLFIGYPRDCVWRRALLTEADLRRVRQIRNEPTWVLISGPARSPVVAGEWAKLMGGLDVANKILQYHDRLVAGEHPPPIVLLGPPDPSPDQLVVLEGNKRTAAACMGDVLVDTLEFLVGVSPSVALWHWYDDDEAFRAAYLGV